MKAILKMLESPDGFKGGMSAEKYISISGLNFPFLKNHN